MKSLLAIVTVVLALTVGLSAQQPQLRRDLAKAATGTMQFHNAELADVLQALGDFVHVTIQISPEVDRRLAITAKFEDATFEDVLTLITTSRDLAYKIIDEKTERMLWKGRSAIGECIFTDAATATVCRRVVGVGLAVLLWLLESGLRGVVVRLHRLQLCLRDVARQGGRVA